ncbi:hypothetical protein Tco_0243188 [Tanacetum coccineum]
MSGLSFIESSKMIESESSYFAWEMECKAMGHGTFLDEEELLFLAGEQANTFDADVDNQPVQDLALNEDNIFQADECDAFDSDVDDEPTAQSIFMANLSSVGPANPQAGPSNASILSEVHILENAIDHSVTNQDEHEIHNEVQQANVIDSTSVDMGVLPKDYKTALGAQNPFYLRQTKKAQPALYDGDELLKTHHVPVIVPSSEEDLDLAETTRNKLHAEMNDSACVEKRIQSRGHTIRELKEKISRLTKKNSDTDPIFDLKALVSQNKDLTAKLNALHDLNEHFREKMKKRVTFVKLRETSTHNTPAQVEHQKINSTNAPGIPSTGVKGASAASRSKPMSNTKKDRTLLAKMP